MIGNLLSHTVTNSGIGDILLGSARNGYAAINSEFLDQSYIFYSLTDGTNKEIGVARYNSGANSLTRVKVFENIVSGVRYKPAVAAMTFTTSAIVGVTNSLEALLFTTAKYEQHSCLTYMFVPAFDNNNIDIGTALPPTYIPNTDVYVQITGKNRTGSTLTGYFSAQINAALSDGTTTNTSLLDESQALTEGAPHFLYNIGSFNSSYTGLHLDLTLANGFYQMDIYDISLVYQTQWQGRFGLYPNYDSWS